MLCSIVNRLGFFKSSPLPFLGMIPQQLTLRNFLSYRQATLDFRGLHVACICGPNGAGKSSLLEAIAWAIWGQSRATTEDDLIHVGEKEAQVNLIFSSDQYLYRIIRTHQRGQATSLEFQVAVDPGSATSSPTFRSLTERKVRATQQTILAHLRLDYDTFINSAYLRQGRADEFMLKRPAERKQLLSELLKLDQYDQLGERAKDYARQLKGQIGLLEHNLATLQAQLQQGEALAQQQAELEATLQHLQQQQTAENHECQRLQSLQNQRQTWQEKIIWLQQQQGTLDQERQQLLSQLRGIQQQQQELATICAQESQILSGYKQFQELQAQEDIDNQKFQAYQQLREQQQQLEQELATQVQHLQGQLQRHQAQLASLQEQQRHIEQVLDRRTEIESALTQLQQARATLSHYDQRQAQVFPLLQRQHQLQAQLDAQTAQLSARLEELQGTVNTLQRQQSRQPQLQQAVLQVTEQIDYLQKRRTYQQHVQEKGLERRSFMERLQAHQRDYQVQLAQLEQKFELLRQPDAICPLCDRPLEQVHWTLVRQKHDQQRQDILDQIWVLREQLAVSEREIQVLRQEYRDLDQELSEFSEILQRRGQLQEQLQTTDTLKSTLEQTLTEVDRLQRSLQVKDYAREIQTELEHLETALSQLDYDEKNHAISRGQVERWRWAEIKQAELRQTERQQAQINRQQPEVEAAIAEVQTQLDRLKGVGKFEAQPLPLQQQLNQLGHRLRELNYSREAHRSLHARLRQAQVWQLRYQELRQAQQQAPPIDQRLQELQQLLQQRTETYHSLRQQHQVLQEQLTANPDSRADLQTLEQQIQQRRQRLDQTLADLGRLQQAQRQLENLSRQFQEQQQQLITARQQHRVYQELAQAFSKNGIQALMIENVLPQLEQETNHILGRLSANQLHVQFVTQRAGRSRKKLIDTLDILIADARGTRPYETYSGGEAFRVNFAIRLALARLLAQRSGSDLQMLIIDEGFGTQDAQGCERLIAAINAIAADFDCILTVTHMPSLKEAFQTRIEVTKASAGSQVSLSV